MFATDSVSVRRRQAIARLGVLERAGDPCLTALTRLASLVTGASAAAVHILDDELQHRVAANNAPLGNHPRADSMCRLVIDKERHIVCVDATQDPRFGYSSFVGGDEPVRFYASVPLRTSTGEVIGSICAFDTEPRELSREQLGGLEDLAGQATTVIELTRLSRELGQAATHDALTGVANRLLLGDRLAQAFARRMRSNGEVFIALCDIDGFKPINDHLGHAAGDEVLVAVADRLRTATREVDTVARVGGDEFVVLAELPPDPEAERAVRERIEAALDAPMTIAGVQQPMRVSVGYVLAEPGEDINGLLGRADAAMYEAKAMRRSLAGTL